MENTLTTWHFRVISMNPSSDGIRYSPVIATKFQSSKRLSLLFTRISLHRWRRYWRRLSERLPMTKPSWLLLYVCILQPKWIKHFALTSRSWLLWQLSHIKRIRIRQMPWRRMFLFYWWVLQVLQCHTQHWFILGVGTESGCSCLSRLSSFVHGMSETEGGQTDEVGRRRHREQADDIRTGADKQTTWRTSKRRGEELVQGYKSLQSKRSQLQSTDDTIRTIVSTNSNERANNRIL